jgi:hypothetical protein
VTACPIAVSRHDWCHAPTPFTVRRPAGRVHMGSGSISLGVRYQCRLM